MSSNKTSVYGVCYKSEEEVKEIFFSSLAEALGSRLRIKEFSVMHEFPPGELQLIGSKVKSIKSDRIIGDKNLFSWVEWE